MLSVSHPAASLVVPGVSLPAVVLGLTCGLSHRDAVEAQTSVPTPECPIQWDWDGTQECAFLTGPSGTLVRLRSLEFFSLGNADWRSLCGE